MTQPQIARRSARGPVAGLVMLLAALACQVSRIDAGSTDVASVFVDPGAVSVPKGSSVTLIAVARDTQGKATGSVIEWTSDDPAVASVDRNGVVTGVGVGQATVMATSGGRTGTASVTVTAPPDGSMASVTVATGTTYQVMKGWEATAQAGAECNYTAYPLYRDELMGRAASELGINRVRLEVISGSENSTNWDSLYVAGAITTDEWRQHRYEVVNDNSDPNVINPAGFHWTNLDRKVDLVVTPLRQAVLARGEQLYVNLAYVDLTHTGFEVRTVPAEFGEFMFAAFQHLQQKYGWVPNAVEMNLEPDHTAWTATQLGYALVAAGDRLAAAGWHPEFIAPSTTSMSAAVTYFDGMQQVSRVSTYLKELSYHRYRDVSTSALQSIATRGVQFGIRTAMLEWIGANDETLRQDLTTGRASAWQEYTLAYCATSDNGGSYYIVDVSNPAAPVLRLASRARYLAQYFRYVRMDAVRIGATASDASLAPVAFRNANGKVVAVVKAATGTAFRVYGLPPATYGVTYTSATATAASAPDVVAAAGQPVTVSVPGGGVVSLFAR